MPRFVGIIPARFGSTRFPGKVLHPLGGKPLIQHVWERCRKAKALTRIIIATDDMRVAESAFAFGAEVAMTKPGHTSGTDRIAEVAAKIPAATHIINIQGDEPGIEPRLIDRLARELAANPKLPIVTAACPLDDEAEIHDPNCVKVVVDRAGNALYFSRHPIPFVREPGTRARHLLHLGIYGYSRRALLAFVRWKPSPLESAEKLEQLRALENGMDIRVVVTRLRSAGIDTPADAARFENQMLKSQPRFRRGR